MLNRKILILTRLHTLLLTRNGGGAALILLSIASVLLIFFISGTQTGLENDLMIRSRYAVWIATFVIGAGMVYLAVLLFSADLSGQQFHAVDATPVRRCDIWFGRLYALWIYGSAAFFCGLITLAVAGFLYAGHYPKTEQRALLHKMSTASIAMDPILPDYAYEVQTEMKRLEQEQLIPSNAHIEEIRDDVMLKVRAKSEDLSPNAIIGWQYPVKGYDFTSQTFLKIAFTAPDRLRQERGIVSIHTENGSLLFESSITAYPYSGVILPVPPEKIPSETEQVEIRFKGLDNQVLSFSSPYHIQLIHQTGSGLENLFIYILLNELWLLSVSALAVGFAGAFSFPTALFGAQLIFTMGFASLFFVSVADHWAAYFGKEIHEHLWINFLYGAGFMLAPFSPPPILENVTAFQMIRTPMIFNWLTGSLCVLIFLSVWGPFLLKRREISLEGNE